MTSAAIRPEILRSSVRRNPPNTFLVGSEEAIETVHVVRQIYARTDVREADQIDDLRDMTQQRLE